MEKKSKTQFIGYYYLRKAAAIFTNKSLQARPVLKLLKDYKLVLIGDREDRSTAFALWLTKKNIYFILRLNKNTLIKTLYKKYQSLNSLDIKPGDRVSYNGVLVTEDNQKNRFNVVIYWKRKYNGKQLPNPWYLLTNLENKEEVIKIFASRGGIEAMFRDCKSGGYNRYCSPQQKSIIENKMKKEQLLFTRLKS